MRTTDDLHPDFDSWDTLLSYAKSKRLKEGDVLTLIFGSIKYLYSYEYILSKCNK